MAMAVLELAARFMSAIENGDIGAVADCYAEDALIWHNFDNKDQTVSENLKVLGWMVKVLENRKYEILRREPIEGGYIQQHVLHGSIVKTGASFVMPACIIVQVKDGRITRLEEYLDVAQATALQG